MRNRGKDAQSLAMEMNAVTDNQGFNYNLVKEFFEMFSVGAKVGLGLNASFISEVGIDLFSLKEQHFQKMVTKRGLQVQFQDILFLLKRPVKEIRAVLY